MGSYHLVVGSDREQWQTTACRVWGTPLTRGKPYLALSTLSDGMWYHNPHGSGTGLTGAMENEEMTGTRGKVGAQLGCGL